MELYNTNMLEFVTVHSDQRGHRNTKEILSSLTFRELMSHVWLQGKNGVFVLHYKEDKII